MRVWLPRRSITLSVTLASIIGGLVGLSALSVLAVEWVVGSDVVVELLDERTRFVLSALENRVRAHLDPARDQVLFLAGLAAQGRLDLHDLAATRSLLLGAVAGTPQVQLIGVVGDDYQLHGVGRHGSDTEIIERPISPKGREEYRLVAERPDPKPYWAEPVFSPTVNTPVLNIRQRMTREGRTIGVLFSTVSILELSEFVDSFGNSLTERRVFILYGRDRVAAHGGVTAALSHLSPEHPLPTLDEVGDPVLAAIWQDPKPYLSPVKGADVHVVTVAGRDWLFRIREVPGYGPEALRVGTYLPLDRAERLLRRLYWAGAAGFGVLLLSLAASVAVGRMLARPIYQLAEQAKLVGSFELAQIPVLPGSFVRELDDQSRAFNAMLASLRWFETYVPKALVRRLMAHSDLAGINADERTLTVMFTDMVGFTATAERMSPSETAEFINQHLTLVIACIDAEMGTVDKYIGDAVMAFWGAPEDQRDHADRACRAALAVRTAIQADNRARAARGEPTVAVRVGIHTGPVVVGNIGAPGRMNYTVVGDSVNTTQRLEALGKEVGQTVSEVTILISGETRAALQSPLLTVFAGAFKVKGRTREIQVFRLDDPALG